jgi:hypothetical protein
MNWSAAATRHRTGSDAGARCSKYPISPGPHNYVWSAREPFPTEDEGSPGFEGPDDNFVTIAAAAERHDTPHAAIQREKNIKHWPRAWKIDLVLSINPQWRDLYDELF